ncbi:MAG TPA: hypothetical protein VIJ02_07585, partial [Thermoanaerobaculia bacterium]
SSCDGPLYCRTIMNNPYLDLTAELNRGRLRVLLSSGQAVVVHRLAIMSKDGDWILREDAEAAEHVLEVLSKHGARYRFGAPLDLRWLAGGWSSHLELRREVLRIRTDFVTRPPRIAPEQLAQMWEEAQATGDDVVRVEPLAAMKLTNRDKDYAVVGELARLMTDPRAQLRYSRSSRDLIQLAQEYPEALAEAMRQRPLLACIGEGREALEEALDRERRTLIRANEERLARYMAASEDWAKIWPEVQRQIEGLSLPEAHRLVVSRAEGVLPFEPAQGADHDRSS